MKGKKYYSITEAAGITGYTRTHIWYLIKTKNIKAEKIGSTWAIPQQEIMKIGFKNKKRR